MMIYSTKLKCWHVFSPPYGSENICFSGGLLGPDGTHRFLGKWCKRGQNSESSSAKRSSNGDLIAVGADGRGGRIKVLRTPNQILSVSSVVFNFDRIKCGFF